MTRILDTDILSFWQTAKGPEYAVPSLRMSAHAAGDVGVSIVSFHEQMAGASAYLNKGRSSADLVEGYDRLARLRLFFEGLTVVSFDTAAAAEFDNLKGCKIRVGTMDLRIAAIALANNLVLVTRNARDFAQVPGLTIEDWTK